MGYNFFAAKKRCTILQSVEIPRGVCTILRVGSKRLVANARGGKCSGEILIYAVFYVVSTGKKWEEIAGKS